MHLSGRRGPMEISKTASIMIEPLERYSCFTRGGHNKEYTYQKTEFVNKKSSHSTYVIIVGSLHT